MIRTIALLCLAAAPAFAGLFGNFNWKGDLKVRFDLAPGNSFFTLPKSADEAVSKGWVQKTRPTSPAGYESLDMWCPAADYFVCILTDKTGYIAGLQIAFVKSKFTPYYDPAVTGFTPWSVDLNGETVEHLTLTQYYITAETLKTEAGTCTPRNKKYMLQDSSIKVTGFNGELFDISTNVQDFTENSIYTEQACIPWMGHHYYYNMSKDLECSAETIFPWFPLVYSKQLIGVGMLVFGTYDHSSLKITPESPPELAVRGIVPSGPDCIYKLSTSPGVITLHTYFIDSPRLVNCVLE